MYIRVNFDRFVECFRSMERGENFTYEGLELLFNHLEEEDLELDMVQICTDWNEYPTLEEAMEELNYDSIKELKRNHFVLGEGPFVIGA